MLAKVFMHMSLVGCHVLWLLWCQKGCLVSQNCDSEVVLPDLWTFGNRSYMWQVKSMLEHICGSNPVLRKAMWLARFKCDSSVISVDMRAVGVDSP